MNTKKYQVATPNCSRLCSLQLFVCSHGPMVPLKVDPGQTQVMGPSWEWTNRSSWDHGSLTKVRTMLSRQFPHIVPWHDMDLEGSMESMCLRIEDHWRSMKIPAKVVSKGKWMRIQLTLIYYNLTAILEASILDIDNVLLVSQDAQNWFKGN